MNWKLEGQKASNEEWNLLDSHSNDPTKQLQVRTFDVSCEEKLKAVKLTQTGKTTLDNDLLIINGFDIFGILLEWIDCFYNKIEWIFLLYNKE